MSFVCCEESPVALTTCAGASFTALVDDFSPAVNIDVARAPYRRVCLHADAPITVVGSDNTGVVTMALRLYRVGVTAPLDFTSVSFTQGASATGTATPSLQLTVEPGRYYVNVEVTRSAGTITSVSGRINVSASVVTLPA